MRRWISFFIVFVMITCIAGCGKSESKKDMDHNASTDQSKGAAMLKETADAPRYDKGMVSDVLSDCYANEGQEFLNNPFNTEEYDSIDENGYKSVMNYPVSTFSADVDTASYSNVRRMLLDGDYFDSGAVRIEEMINYFSYDYEEPDSEHPFGITTELADCPWNKDTKLMLLGVQTEKIDATDIIPSSNLVFLIDVSGSMMDFNKLPLVQRAFDLLTDNLKSNDRISIVTYASNDDIVLEGAKGNEKGIIMDAINDLNAYGSTHGSKGIQTAYEVAEKYFIPDGNNRVILATDGDLNVGITSESDLTKLIKKKRESGVYLSVLGFGVGNIKDNKMEALADHGNGNYSYIDSIMEAKKVLVEEMGATLVTVAKDVKFQVEFNPSQVKGYRLLGYENRLLATEDFEDDTKDAGEVGAGHSVTVLYEVVLSDSAMEVPSTDLKYQFGSDSSTSDELLTVSIRYKKPKEDTSILMTHPVTKEQYQNQMSDNLRFASAVAQFGMVLVDSNYKGTATMDSILKQVKDMDLGGDEYKEEFVALVTIAKRNFQD